MKKIILFTFICFYFVLPSKLLAVCNWKSNIKQFAAVVSDSCPNKYFYGGISLSSSKGITYKWSLGSSVISTSSNFSYTPTANGYYTICVKLIDTVNKCDTTICSKSLWYNCSTGCNWKGRFPTFKTWDTCRGKGDINNINGSISFNNNTSCFKYTWTVNNFVKGTGKTLKYSISSNGTYDICVKVTDTCNKCDTTFCETKKISCFSTPCKWYLRKPAMGVWDSCVSKGSKNNKVNAYISFNNNGTCYKYQWTVNNIAAGNNYIMNKGITANGTYTICVKITDTCDKCDTTICKNITVSCLPSPCNWKSRDAQFAVWDSCKTKNGKSNVNGYINFSNKCMKYEWKVNNTYAGNGNNMSQIITQNGTYTICLNVTDTCNKCDTTYCATKTINCFTQKCNWMDKFPTFTTFDSCKGYKGKTNSIGAYISFKSNSSCFKYEWTINNSLISSPSNVIVNPLLQNGTYSICVKVTDTCNKCDTTFCIKRTISCFTSKCIWKNRITCFDVKDSCAGKYLFGKVCLATNNTTGCIKKQWTVGGFVKSTGNDFKYNITKNGIYEVCLKLTDTCNKCDTTLCKTIKVNCNSLGYNNIQTDKIKIYPNPANSVLNIELENSQNSSYQLVNILGEVITNGNLNETSNTINTSTLANGVYILKLSTNSNTHSYKIVIQQ